MIWIALAPVLFLMAAISTVRSTTTYYVQLSIFSAVAVAGFVCGTAALLRQAWAGICLMVLSYLGAVYFFGAAIFTLLWPLMPGSKAQFTWFILLVPLMIAPWGVPFLLMARSVKSLIDESAGRTPSGEA